jgi:RsiW-degrading membrane proteinase PrsW (M82 family)
VAPLWLLAFFLALAPGGALLWYIRRLDKYEPEPWKTVGWAFLAGCLSVLPALVVESLWGLRTGGFMATLFNAFVVVGLTEELSKGALAYLFMWRRPEFNEVMDGIVYFGVAHMGFAITENLMYVFVNSGGNVAAALMTGFARATTAVPLHVINGMIMGFHLGAYRYGKRWTDKARHLLQAALLPVALHGVYDVAAFNQDVSKVQDVAGLIRVGFGTALMYAAVAALWLFLIPRVQQAQEASPWKPPSWPVLPAAPEGCPACGALYPVGAHYCPMCGVPVLKRQEA